MYDVLTIGELNCDLIMTGLKELPQLNREIMGDSFQQVLGSSTAICAAGLSALGLNVGFHGIVGDDDGGRFACDALAKTGVDVTHCMIDKTVNTGVTIALNALGDRALVTYLGAIETFRFDQIDLSLLSQTRHIHVGSFFLQHGLRPGLAKLFKLAQEAGVTTSLDAGWDDTGEWDGGLAEVLKYTTIFLPNETEAVHATGAKTPEEAAKRLPVKICVVKCGADGAIAYRDGQLYKGQPFKVTPVDTTGAGDSFNAGFLYGFLNNLPMEDCLTYGNACGAVSVTKVGGASACATLADVREKMAQ